MTQSTGEKDTAEWIRRQNILNNVFAVSKFEKKIDISKIEFNGKPYITSKDVQNFFGIGERTLRRHVKQNRKELTENGYIVIKGEAAQFVGPNNGTHKNTTSKTRNQGLFSIRAFLDFAMLLPNNEKAQNLRSQILDVTARTIIEMSGGNTTYINQRDEKYILSSFMNQNYNKKLKVALKKYVTDSSDTTKYPNYNDKIYKIIFKENALEYKRILSLDKKDKIRDTLYSEVLSTISSFENTFAEELKVAYSKKGLALTREEADQILEDVSKHPAFEPQIELARCRMATLDREFRKKNHEKLKNYVGILTSKDYETFLGERGRALAERARENEDVLKRLKDK